MDLYHSIRGQGCNNELVSACQCTCVMCLPITYALYIYVATFFDANICCPIALVLSSLMYLG